ncbi:MAG TPA: hypothetical protein VMM76_24405 [Pirellulaceae bacterium]|nr:hypothetical protein [Pirellulaceae bacterium]
MDITNGIWLCQTHAKLIDTDEANWTIERLIDVKRSHEAQIQRSLGVPILLDWCAVSNDDKTKRKSKGLRPRECAFVRVGDLIPEYRIVLKPMLDDRELSDDAELGILMSGDREGGETEWTTFVDAEWLRWLLRGQESGFGFSGGMPSEFIYGRMPAWPDTFFEFLAAIVMAGTTFAWQRSEGGFLCLSQPNDPDTRVTAGTP